MLWSLGRGVISHESALAFYEMSDVMPDVVHLTVPPAFRKRRPDIVLHRESLGPKTLGCSEAGLQRTTPIRTIADAARSSLSPEHLEAAVLDGLRLGLFSKSAVSELPLDLPHEAAVRLRTALRAAGANA